MSDPVVVGVIADTHGLLRPEAIEALEGCDLIVHAGDVGDEAILDVLDEIAPVTAVRGNMDRGELGRRLPLTEVVSAGDATLYLIHIVEELDLDPVAAGFDAVIYGHTHEPALDRRDGVLWLNPGSAGPRRFDLPVTLARVTVAGGELEVEHVRLTGAR